MTHSLPTFLFIGPDKSGSTWLYEVLKAHPEVFLPAVKELFFFDRFYDRGIDWYASKFRHATSAHQAAGEICHDYLFSAIAAERIWQELPKAKLIVMVRNPVDRTFSHWRYRRRSGDTKYSFEDDLRNCPAIFDHSCYSRHLEPYFELFPSDQILILEFSDLEHDPEGLAARVCDFIGADRTKLSARDVLVRHNPASTARKPALVAFMRRVGNFLRSLGFEALVGRLKSSPTFRALVFQPVNNNNRPELLPTTRARLNREFEQYNKELETMLGKSIRELWDTKP